jgi:hypothetical protein
MTGNKRPLISSKTPSAVPQDISIAPSLGGGERGRTDPSAISGEENSSRFKLYSGAHGITWPVMLAKPRTPLLLVRGTEATTIRNLEVSVTLSRRIKIRQDMFRGQVFLERVAVHIA